MFGFKKKVHRDKAANLFIEHCHAEGSKLRTRIISSLRDYCDGNAERPTLDAVVARPIMTYGSGNFRIAAKTLMDAHCYGIATAGGLDAVAGSIDPSHQTNVMLWQVNKLIVEEDVGKDRVGRAPSPRPAPGVHISYAPGTFVSGIPSQQQQLVNRYQSLHTAAERLTMVLLALGVFHPQKGVSKIVYEESDLGHGIVGRNKIELVRPNPDQIDEWEEDLEISDAGAALSQLPGTMVRELLSAIDTLDPFWPTYCRKHRLTW